MKYMLLIYQNADDVRGSSAEDEPTSVMAEVDALMNELTESGEWSAARGWPTPRRPGPSGSATASRP